MWMVQKNFILRVDRPSRGLLERRMHVFFPSFQMLPTIEISLRLVWLAYILLTSIINVCRIAHGIFFSIEFLFEGPKIGVELGSGGLDLMDGRVSRRTLSSLGLGGLEVTKF